MNPKSRTNSGFVVRTHLNPLTRQGELSLPSRPVRTCYGRDGTAQSAVEAIMPVRPCGCGGKCDQCTKPCTRPPPSWSEEWQQYQAEKDELEKRRAIQREEKRQRNEAEAATARAREDSEKAQLRQVISLMVKVTKRMAIDTAPVLKLGMYKRVDLFDACVRRIKTSTIRRYDNSAINATVRTRAHTMMTESSVNGWGGPPFFIRMRSNHSDEDALVVVHRARLVTLQALEQSFSEDPLNVEWLHATEGLCGLEGGMTKLESLKKCLQSFFWNISATDALLVLDYVFTGEMIPRLRRVRTG